MSESLKTRVEVQTILRSVVLAALNAFGYGDFACLEFAQSRILTSDKTVFMNHVSSERVGFQGVRYAIANTSGADEQFNRIDEWIDEQTWQLHVVCKSNVSDVYAEDVAEALRCWFNGSGIETLRNSGIAPLRVSDADIASYVDDSDLYQKRAVVTVVLQVPKQFSQVQNELEANSQYDIPDVAKSRGIFGV